jgi:hypothetical protein
MYGAVGRRLIVVVGCVNRKLEKVAGYDVKIGDKGRAAC